MSAAAAPEGPAGGAATRDDVRRSLQRLDVRPVQVTVRRLQRRIEARFPERSLAQVAVELDRLVDVVAQGAERSQHRTRMLALASRAGILLIVALVAAAGFLAVGGRAPTTTRGLDWLPLIESAVNDLVFAGIAVYFLSALPQRAQRSQLLALLHRLRSLAHIIDMHQLTKDPERLRPDFQATTESADMRLDRDDLQHYLDYCSELLSLVAKTAALCAEESTDAVVLDTVSTIETMTTEMSAKIWQKISLLPD